MRHPFKFMQRKWFKNLKFFFYSAFLMAGSLACIFARHGSYRHSLSMRHFIGWVGLVLFGCACLMFAYRTIKNMIQGREAVMFTDEGLLYMDNLIPWDAIIEVGKLNSLVVITTDGRMTFLSEPSPLKKLMLRISKRFSPGQFGISDLDYDGSQDEFIEKIKDECRRRKAMKNGLGTMRE